MCETGAICRIGVSQQNGAFFGAQKGSFSEISHYQNSDALRYGLWATFVENVVRNRRSRK